MSDKTFSSAQSLPSSTVDVGECRPVSSCLGPLGLFSGSCVPDSAALVVSPSEGRDPVVSAVTLIIGTVVALTFMFAIAR